MDVYFESVLRITDPVDFERGVMWFISLLRRGFDIVDGRDTVTMNRLILPDNYFSLCLD